LGDVETLATEAIDCGLKLHQRLGPGLFESVYETLLAESLIRRGFAVERQKLISVEIDGIHLTDAFRADLLVEGKLLIELKSVERAAPVHIKQVLTYLRLMDLPLGLLMNFGEETFRMGLKRVVNTLSAFPSPSRLRVNPHPTAAAKMEPDA
jgi:GxxExxY protein